MSTFARLLKSSMASAGSFLADLVSSAIRNA